MSSILKKKKNETKVENTNMLAGTKRNKNVDLISKGCTPYKEKSPWGGIPYETDGDARRLALGCKFWIVVSLSYRVFRAQHQYIKPPRNTELREEKQKSNFLFNLFCFRISVFLRGLS